MLLRSLPLLLLDCFAFPAAAPAEELKTPTGLTKNVRTRGGVKHGAQQSARQGGMQGASEECAANDAAAWSRGDSGEGNWAVGRHSSAGYDARSGRGEFCASPGLNRLRRGKSADVLNSLIARKCWVIWGEKLRSWDPGWNADQDSRAEIIKVEHPTRGDDTRAWGPPYAEYKPGEGIMK